MSLASESQQMSRNSQSAIQGQGIGMEGTSKIGKAFDIRLMLLQVQLSHFMNLSAHPVTGESPMRITMLLFIAHTGTKCVA